MRHTDSSPKYRRRVGISGAEDIAGLHRSTLWRKYMAGEFPLPHFIAGERKWFVDELEAWCEKEMARPQVRSQNFKGSAR